jgi:hypothetical protein
MKMMTMFCGRPASKHLLLKAVLTAGVAFLVIENLPALVRYMKIESM